MTKSSRAGTILRRSLVLAPALVVLVVYALGPGGPVPLGPLAAVPVALAPAGGPAGAGAPPAAIAAPAGVPSPAPDPAAGAQPVPHGFTTAGHTARFDVRHLPPAASGHHREGGGEPEHEAPPVVLAQAGSLADVGSGTSLDASAPAPGPSSSFEGLAFDDACGATPCGDGHPPDTNGDVGPTYYIQAVNTAIGIFDKATGTRVAGFTFDAFMAQGHQGNLCDTDNFGDPVVLYDTFADRWIISDFAFQVDASGNVVSPPGSYQCIAVSQSGDPVSGGWSFYSVHVTDALQDYPKLGIWPDGLYLSANLFAFGGTQAFQNVRVWALNKAEMEAGQTAQVVSFDAPSKVQGVSVFGLLPANARLQAGAPPAGAPNDFASVWAWTNRVRVWKFHVDWANTGSSTFTGPFDSMTSTSWTTPPDTVPEKDGNALDTLAMRLMVQNQYSNIGGVESLWTTHTVAGSSASQAAIRWYQVPVTGGTVGNALQASTYNPDTRNRWMASAAVDRAGDMAIGYSVSDATIHPAIRYAGRLAGDPADAITQSETSLIQGGGAQSGNCGGAACERWGDYSAMTLDPDGCTFWYTNEYYASTGLNDHTRIGSFRFPSCQDVPLPSPTPTPSPVPTPTPTASPTPIPTPSPAPTPTPTATAAASPTATPAPPGVTKFWPDTGAVTNASPIVYELWFNVPVSGLASDDFIASGPATTGGTCSVSPSAVSSSEFLVSVTGCVDGSLGLQLKANSVSGNGTTGPSPAVSAPAITIDRTAPSVTVPVLSSVTVLPGAALTVTATAADIEGIAAADRNVAGAGWTFMTAVDGSWGGTSEALSSPVTAPATAGTYAVCVRATDNADNTSDGSACASLTVADFSVSASPTSRSVRQGDGGSFAIAIGRSGFASAVRLSATGLPPGANATFSPNPAPGGSATMAVTTSNCGTVTPRGTYTLTITGTDASGSTLHHATTVSMAVTNAPPTVGGPVSTLYAGTKLGASSINVVTRWSACDPDGTRAYALRRQVDGGAWRTVSLSPATSTSVTEALARGSPYRYEVRATDRLGSSGAYSLGPSFTARATDQASSAVHYAGRWTTAAGSSAYGGSSRYATAPGASVSYTFSGTSIAWVSSRGPTRGSAAVYVDGVLRATVSLHSSTFSARATVFAASWATGGTHTIRIVVSGTSGHPRVDVDAFVRLTRV